MDQLADYQNRLMAHAMGCGLAPIGRLEYLEQHGPTFGIPSLDADIAASGDGWHDPIVHAVNGWEKDDPVRVAGFTFFVEKFADLLVQLDSMVEGPDGQTVLDNSIVVLGSDYGEGDGHSSHDLCFLVAGGSGPGRRGYHSDVGGYNSNQFLTSLIQMACVTNDDGSPVQEFGLRGFTSGAIPDLLT